MTWHLTPKTLEARHFAPGHSYEDADTFDAAAVITLCEDQATVSMALSRGDRELTLGALIALARTLWRDYGVRQLTVWRKAGRRMPFGQPGRTVRGVTEWRIDLTNHLHVLEPT